MKPVPLHEIGKAMVAGTLCIATCLVGANEPATCSAANSDEAIRILRAKIRSERLYASWAKEQCLELYPERCDPAKVDVAVRELHGEDCGGDPHVAPVVDRFRIYRKSKKLEWYSVVNDEYLDFSKVRSVGSR